VDISIFCDESCHLEADKSDVMALGAIWCETSAVPAISKEIRQIKQAHGLALPAGGDERGFEMKWSKVSPGKLSFYEEIVAYFIDNDRLHFRGMIVNNKKSLDHERFSQTHDEFYYKCYYNLLIRLLEKPNNTYSVYLDIKDTRGGPKTKKLQSYLCSKIRDQDCSILKRVEQIRSDESEILQLTDLILGAVSYYNRGGNQSHAKLGLIDVLATRGRAYPRDLSRTSYLSEGKVNLLSWTPAAAG